MFVVRLTFGVPRLSAAPLVFGYLLYTFFRGNTIPRNRPRPAIPPGFSSVCSGGDPACVCSCPLHLCILCRRMLIRVVCTVTCLQLRLSRLASDPFPADVSRVA